MGKLCVGKPTLTLTLKLSPVLGTASTILFNDSTPATPGGSHRFQHI